MTMNTIRLCFTVTIVFLVVAIGGRDASSIDNIVWVRKCCPVDQLYDPKVRSCRPVGANGNEYDQRLMNRLRSGFRVASNATLKSSIYAPPYCDYTEVLVDVLTEEMRMLMEADPSPIEFPAYYCFDLTPSDELVSQTCRPLDQYCGRGNCMCVRKCCPADRLYDPKVRSCRPVGADGDDYDQRLMNRLESGFQVATNATSKRYIFKPPHCDDTQVLVDVPTEEVRMLMEADPSPIELPLNYCFDLTPSDELVARTCRPRDQYCGRGNYTCVNKCCNEEYILYDNPNIVGMLGCKYSEIPFQFYAYETDVGGSPVGLSNNKVLQYSGGFSLCFAHTLIHNGVTLTTDGNLYIIHEGVKWIIPKTKYCVDYYDKDETTGAADLMALVCSKPPVSFLFWFKTLSVICLVLTLIVYATLPYLRNAHGYYVMCYMACHLVYLVCIMIYSLVNEDTDSPLCIPFGYFMLFATLITCCWLNVICFDIYWMLRGMLGCKYSEIPFQFYAYETDVGGSPVGLSNNKVLQYSGGFSLCFAHTLIHNGVTLTTDGNLYIIHEGVKWIIPKTKYCVDYYDKDETTGAADLMALVCSKPPVSFLFWFKTLSVICLVLTLIVYATLPYLRNAHGYYVMCYMACHLVYLVCIMIYSLVNEDTDSPLCIPFGYFMLFATLITCCWLNVICFDIYWMLRYNNSPNRNSSKSVRTIMYHIYCWGFSSICVSTGYLFEFSENRTLWKFAPDIGLNSCFFFGIHRTGTLIFYWLPSCGTLTVNLILFLLTAIHCLRIKAELNKFRRTDSKTEIFLFYKERFVMSIKLFLVFGIPFLFSLLCELFQFNWIIRMIIDSIHGLQGVFMFIIFVAKRNVIMDLRKKFRRSIVHSELTPLNNISGPS